MNGRQSGNPKIILWAVMFGILFNALGWLGNNLVLGTAWDAANEGVKAGYEAPWPSIVKELVSLVSDFLYAFALVWVFAHARDKTVGFALKLSIVIWLVGAALTYLVMVNAGFLPVGIAIKTSLLALVIFLASALLLPVVIKNPLSN